MEDKADKGMDQKEKWKQNIKLGEELRMEDIAVYNEMFCMNCEIFEEILTAIRPVINKTADQKTIMNYHTRGQMGKIIINYHKEFEQALNAW